MKKILSILLTAATLGITTSCEDVPAPYDIYAGQNTSAGKALPYKSTNLNSGWTTHAITEYNPWSQGSNYTQATGYQDWDGSGKSNKEVEGYLISPALSTICESGKVAITFDHVIAYSSYDAQYADHIGMFISADYDGDNFDAATWTKLPFEIESAALNSSWSLFTIPAVQVPDEFVNKENIYVAFYFYASAANSITWELENFYIMEGEGNSADDDPTVSGGTTLETALTVAQANALIAGGKGLSNKYYVKGTITGTPEIDTSYGNATYYITDGTETLEIYRGYTLGGKKFTSKTELKDGDEVVIYGTLVNYNGTYEFTTGSQIVSLNGTVNDPNAGTSGGETAAPAGSGTASDPYNVAAALAFGNAGNYTNSNPSKEIYIKGIVSQIGDLNSQYGELNYYISDDGSQNNEFYVYNGFGLDGAKINSKDYLSVGDEVVVVGTVVKYNSIIEFKYGSKIVSLTSNGGNTGGDDNDPSGGSEGVTIDGTTVTLTNSEAVAGSETITVDLNTLGYENKAEMGTVTLNDGTTIVFDAGSNEKYSPVFYDNTKGARVYANNTITFNGKKQIATIIMNCDALNGTNYVGNETATVSVSGNTIVYTNASATAGTQLRVQTITIVYAQ